MHSLNNNATVSENRKVNENIQQGKSQKSTRSRNKSVEEQPVQTSYRVQWTKEFMDKVRKSNEKHQRNLDNKNVVDFQNEDRMTDQVAAGTSSSS